MGSADESLYGSGDPATAVDSGGPRGLDSHVVLQRARARLLGRTETLARIGRYSVTHRIGLGGMGVVYAAHDPDLDRDVAIKVLRKEVDDDPVRQAWLMREAQALAKLNHPNVVHVYEVGKTDGHVFLAMELVEGRTLRAWVRSECPPWREIVAQYVEAGRGLAAAHRVGIVHRDFKPDNVIIGQDGRTRVLDFGLAGLDPGSTLLDSQSSPSASGSGRLTIAGGVSGTPNYMAPEQHLGAELSPAADQFAFCVSMWEAICGAAPFAGEGPQELGEAKRRGPPSWPKSTPCARAVIDALRRGLAPEPDRRWPSMDALLRALESALSPVRKHRVAFAGAAIALVACSTAVASWRDRAEVCSGAHEQLGDAWSAERRDASRQAFAATGLSYAERTWQRAATTIDAYAADWATEHTAACEATRVRGEQSVELMDARIACLHAARRALGAATDLLARADEQVVERADDLVAGLPMLARCGDVEALLDRIAPPPVELADDVEEIRAIAATASSLERAGKYEDAYAALLPAIERAERSAYEPVQTEISFLSGTLHERLGRYDEAEAAQAAALQSALHAGQWDEAARASTALVMTVGSFQRDAKRGLGFAPTARGLIDRAADPEMREAELHRVLGSVYRGTGELARSEEEFRTALALTLASPNSDAIDVSGIQMALGSLLEAKGDLEGAAVQLSAAVDIRTEHLGVEHPRTANVRHNYGALLAKRGDLEGAVREYRATLEVFTRAHGPRHPTVGMARSNLATVLEDLGQNEDSEVEKRAALEIFLEAYGPDHPHVASARQNLATALGRRGEHAAAVAELRQAIAALEAKLGGDHPTVATVRLNLGMELSDLGQHDEAVAELQAGTDRLVAALGETNVDVANARTELARAQLRAGDARAALANARAGWAVYETSEGPPQRRAASAFMVARTLRATHGPAEDARRHAERALELLPPDDETRATIESWLASPDDAVPSWP